MSPWSVDVIVVCVALYSCSDVLLLGVFYCCSLVLPGPFLFIPSFLFVSFLCYVFGGFPSSFLSLFFLSCPPFRSSFTFFSSLFDLLAPFGFIRFWTIFFEGGLSAVLAL